MLCYKSILLIYKKKLTLETGDERRRFPAMGGEQEGEEEGEEENVLVTV